MPMTTIPARRLWNQQIRLRVGQVNLRTLAANGTVKLQFLAKLFPSSGRAITVEGRVAKRGGNIEGRIPMIALVGDGGYRLQTYWKFQYDLDIAGLSPARRLRGVGTLGDTKVKGLENIIQSFDVVPPKHERAGHSAVFRMVRGDTRSQSVAPWEWEYNHSRSVRSTRSGPSINTVTRATLPVAYSGSVSYEVAVSVGGEVGWNLGPAVTANASVSAGGGTSVNIDYRSRLETRLMGFVNLVAGES